MKIAIHSQNQEHFFSYKWETFFKENNIDFKIVNAYSNDIMIHIKDCDAFMWHFSNYDYRDMLFARQLLYSIKNTGLSVFPDFNTCWHFDDKLGQKYLLEGIEAPLVKSYAFQWSKLATYPMVFKLRGGSGSSNVKLVRNKQQCNKLIRKAFGCGFAQFDRLGHLKERIRRVKAGLDSPIGIAKGLYRMVFPTLFSKMYIKEKGYGYFQDFIPNNTFDIRVVVTGNKAFAIKRMTRENDFRASGGGAIVYDKKEIDDRCVKIAFDINNKLKTQSIAFDFVFDLGNNPLVVEISYGYVPTAYLKCPGYWDSEMNWYGEPINPEKWQIEDLINQIICNENSSHN